MMTYQELLDLGYFDELARAFDEKAAARQLLEDAGVPTEHLPPFGQLPPSGYWREVGKILCGGKVETGISPLLEAAALRRPDKAGLWDVFSDVDAEALREHLAEGGGGHEELRERYLRWVAREHGTLELPGLPQVGGRPAVELETVYVALRGDMASSHERRQSRDVLERQARLLEDLPAVDTLAPDQKHRMLAQLVRLISVAPLPDTIEERDRPQLLRSASAPRDQTVSLGEAFRQERRLAILGDPGSGKTTLVRWLTLQLARACLHAHKDVGVLAHHVEPDAMVGEKTLSLGPSRLPILVRVASFAEARKENPQLSLAAFLGHHLAPLGQTATDAEGRTLPPQDLHELFLKTLRAGRAVLLLDGLDEINDPVDRWEIVQEIDKFLDTWLPREEPLEMADNPARSFGRRRWRAARTVGAPHEVGGIQVIVTSRIVGYQMAPLSSEATHLTIEPMELTAVERFCDVWVHANHRAAQPGDAWNQAAEEAAFTEADGLKAAIRDLHARGAADLASNPLLVTILALVYQHRAGFPRQRVRLYEMAVAILLEKWRRRALGKGERPFRDDEVLAILIPLAADIHTTSGIGMIDEQQLDTVLARHLEPKDRAAFRTVLREEVGLLTARGEGVYGFLHLTFQEYLAGLHLIRDRAHAAERILEKLAAPRWREPILMAVGQLSSEVRGADLERVLERILKHPDPLGHLIPRAALLLVGALDEMARIPRRTAEIVSSQLLEVAAREDALERFPDLRKHVETAYTRLLERDGAWNLEVAEAAEGVLCAALCDPKQPSERQAAARLVRACRAASPALAAALEAALPEDSAAWGWPVDHALRELKARAPEVVLGERGALGRVLARDEELAKGFLADPGWIRLGIALYGGIDSGLPERIAEAGQKVAALDEEIERWNKRPEDPRREGQVANLTERRKARQATLDELKKRGHLFHLQHIYRDVPWLTHEILSCLREGRPAESLLPMLRKRSQGVAAAEQCPETFLARAALGDLPRNDPTAEDFPGHGLEHLSRLTQPLEIALASSLDPTFAALESLATHCSGENWADLIEAMVTVEHSFAQTPSAIVLSPNTSESLKRWVQAESWHHWICGQQDKLYNISVVLDTSGLELADPPERLVEAFACAHRVAGARRSQHHGWQLEPLAPLPEGPIETLGAALDALAMLPEPFAIVRGWALQVLAARLAESGFLPEALAIVLGLPAAYQRVRSDALAALLSQAGQRFERLRGESPAEGTGLLLLDLLSSIDRISDPYLRFRGYWQLLRHSSDLRGVLLISQEPVDAPQGGIVGRLAALIFSQDEPLNAQAPKAAAEIRDPGQQVWAFERLAAVAEDPGRWMRRARRSALRIPARQAAQRARALARIAPAFDLNESHALLRQALDATGAIIETRRRAETLRALRGTLIGVPELEKRFRDLVDGLDDPWYHAKAQGFAAPLFARYAEHFDAAGADLVPLRLAATVHDLERRFGLPRDPESLWIALGTERKDKALVALRDMARRDGLRITREAAVAIDWLLETGEHTTVRELLPLLEAPGELMLPIVRQWPAHNPGIGQLTDLLRAEAGDFSESVLGTLIELLEHPEDRIRYRASLALHGDTFSNRRGAIKISRLGSSAAKSLAHFLVKHPTDKIAASQVISWAINRLEHDDSGALKAWIASAERDSGDKEEAKILLSKIQRIESSTLRTLFTEYPKCSPDVQLCLLKSICRLLHFGFLSEDAWDHFAPHVRASAAGLPADAKILLDPERAVIEAAEAVLGMTPRPHSATGRVAVARQWMERQKIALGQVLVEDHETATQHMREIGSLFYVNTSYFDRIRAVAERAIDKPSLVEIMVDWLAHELHEETQEPKAEWFSWTQSTLLGILAATAERLPNTFLNRARLHPSFGRGLREAAESQEWFTGRQSALVLLSFLREPSEDARRALHSGLRDVLSVQQTVFETVGRYRDLDRTALDPLFANLHDASTTVAYATAQLLGALARNLHLPPADRDAILEAFANAIDDPRSQREVYIYHEENIDGYEIMKIRHAGRLDEIFFQTLLELSGVVDLTQRHQARSMAVSQLTDEVRSS